MLFTPDGGITFATLLLRKRVRVRGGIFPLKSRHGVVAMAQRRRKIAEARAISHAKFFRMRQIFRGWHGNPRARIVPSTGSLLVAGPVRRRVATGECIVRAVGSLLATTSRVRSDQGPTLQGGNASGPPASLRRQAYGAQGGDPASDLLQAFSSWCGSGSVHLPCSRINATRRASASACGMLYWTQFLPT